MPHYTFDGLKLFRSLEKAAIHAVDNHLNPDSARELIHGKLYPLNRHDLADFLMYCRQYTIF